MATIEELEALTTEELKERAFRRARHRLDVRFFWRLLEAVPAAEAAAGHFEEAREDVVRMSEKVQDLLHPDSPEEAEALRPMYIEYLLDRGEGGAEEGDG
jgi:hypothetical protein